MSENNTGAGFVYEGEPEGRCREVMLEWAVRMSTTGDWEQVAGTSQYGIHPEHGKFWGLTCTEALGVEGGGGLLIVGLNILFSEDGVIRSVGMASPGLPLLVWPENELARYMRQIHGMHHIRPNDWLWVDALTPQIVANILVGAYQQLAESDPAIQGVVRPPTPRSN